MNIIVVGHWFPIGEGKNYKLTKSLSHLERHRNDISIIGGLSHPNSRSVLGHMAGDSFLTGGDLRGYTKIAFLLTKLLLIN